MNTTIYEYAGFRYYMFISHTGEVMSAVPAPGQHSAANKDKHKRNAIECFKIDYRKAIRQ